MKFFFVISLLVSLASVATAACNCRGDDTSCLQSCVSSANECIQNCQGNTQCYTGCIEQYWPTSTIPASSAVATSASSASGSQSASQTGTTTQSATTTAPPDGSGASKLSANGLIVAVLMSALIFH
ncbi:hypothetical protein BJV82DRAFT_618446 [Fennellomyces sp. T-0311]|nr:hypothetical protein BJV82DRAFT_618446 [Fennellomyces sp. T-0311]